VLIDSEVPQTNTQQFRGNSEQISVKYLNYKFRLRTKLIVYNVGKYKLKGINLNGVEPFKDNPSTTSMNNAPL
jgi:hypothetical protein